MKLSFLSLTLNLIPVNFLERFLKTYISNTFLSDAGISKIVRNREGLNNISSKWCIKIEGKQRKNNIYMLTASSLTENLDFFGWPLLAPNLTSRHILTMAFVSRLLEYERSRSSFRGFGEQSLNNRNKEMCQSKFDNWKGLNHFQVGIVWQNWKLCHCQCHNEPDRIYGASLSDKTGISNDLSFSEKLERFCFTKTKTTSRLSF